jgi:hypothetical protein
MLALHPSVTLLRWPWQLDAIWRANQPGAAEDTGDLARGGVLLQVWRWGEMRRSRGSPALIREVLDEEVLVPV